MDREILERFGLNDNEVKVYLALLKFGSLSGGQIADKTNIHRRTAYDTLTSLTEKGLISFIVKEKIKYFKAVDPKRLLDILKEREEEIKATLPELESLYTESKEKVDAQIYQGIKSVKKIFEEVLSCKEYSVLGAGEPLRKMLMDFFLLFQKRKRELKIKSRVLIALKYKKEPVSTKTLGQVKFLEEYDPPTTTYIYGDKVAVIISEPIPTGFVMESKEVNKSFLDYFNLLWKQAKK